MGIVEAQKISGTEFEKDINRIANLGYDRDMIWHKMTVEEIICTKNMSDDAIKKLMEKVSVREEKKKG